MAKAKVSVLVAGVTTLMCIILLILSYSAVTAEAGRQWEGREPTVAARGRFRKLMREETTLDDGGAAIGESKRRSPGGPDPQHH
uniref:Uncharacterized protein n=1 Tax=Oryza glaberrima TaxID=4538 RepID=I1PXW6_ORYGL